MEVCLVQASALYYSLYSIEPRGGCYIVAARQTRDKRIIRHSPSRRQGSQ